MKVSCSLVPSTREADSGIQCNVPYFVNEYPVISFVVCSVGPEECTYILDADQPTLDAIAADSAVTVL